MQRPSVLEIPMGQRLNTAIDRRIESENKFIEDLIAEMNKAILTLDQFDPANARSAIDLTQEQLREIVFKLNDVNNMTGRTTNISNIVKDNHLMRRPDGPEPPAAAMPPTQPSAPPAQLGQAVPTLPPAPPGQAVPTLPPAPQAKPQARNLGTRTRLDPISGGRRTRRKRKTRR